ncbi:HD domain-containing protein [Chloroflexota bacterium]
MNLDYLIAGAILHDLDKPLIYHRKQDKVVYSEVGEMIPHGTYGVHVALELGLPLEIVHVIITHTAYCAVNPSTVEGVIIQKAEILVGSAMTTPTRFTEPTWKYPHG